MYVTNYDCLHVCNLSPKGRTDGSVLLKEIVSSVLVKGRLLAKKIRIRDRFFTENRKNLLHTVIVVHIFSERFAKLFLKKYFGSLSSSSSIMVV